MNVFVYKKIVKKHFHQKNISHFLNEIYWLKKLKDYEFIPKILKIDYKNLILSLTNEGEKISIKNKPLNWQKQLKLIIKYLKKITVFMQISNLPIFLLKIVNLN